MTGRKPRGLHPEEKELWEKVRQSTVPLQESAKVNVADAIQTIDRPKVHLGIRDFVIGGSATPAPPNRTPVTGVSVAMDSKKYGKLKKGKLSPDSKIDLHGMTLNEAHPALIGFILSAHQESSRLVLVITGKGKPSTASEFFPSQEGILKQQVPRWLGEHPLAHLVLQVSEAHGKHGGSGALYVYLRRRR